MRGFLKSNDGVFMLMPKLTMIGREGCNLVIQSTLIESQHAVIEFEEQNRQFVLQDLNSTNGTYINDCCVQNASIRLAPKDVIRFGSYPTTYEFLVDNQIQTFCPPVTGHRPAWAASSISVLSDESSAISPTFPNALPRLRSANPTPAWQGQQTSDSNARSAWSPHPPANLRSRPLSAGARRPSLERLPQGNGYYSNPTGAASQSTLSSSGIANMTGTEIISIHDTQTAARHSSLDDTSLAQKDELISQLRDEVVHLQMLLRQAQVGSQVDVPSSESNSVKIMQLDKTKVDQSVRTISTPLSSIRGIGQMLLENSSDDANSLRQELDLTKKDRNLTMGLVSQMHRDMTNKDVTINRILKELEELKKQLVEKDTKIVALKLSAERRDQNKEPEEELETREKEIAVLRYKMKNADNLKQELNETITTLRKDLAQMKMAADRDQIQMKKLKTELETTKIKFQDMERSERLVRVALEQVSKRLEKLRGRVIQTAYSAPGTKVPDKQLTDDDLMAALKKILDERVELTKKIKSLEDGLASDKKLPENSKKLKQQLNEASQRLNERGQVARNLEAEIQLVKSINCENDYLSDIRDVFVQFLQSELVWEKQIEAAFDKFSLQSINEGPIKCISDIHGKLQDALKEKNEMKLTLDLVQTRQKVDVEEAVNKRCKQIKDDFQDEMEKIRHENELKLIRAVSETQQTERANSELAVQTEREKVDSLQISINSLKRSLQERECSLDSIKVETTAALEAVEISKRVEKELQNQIKRLESTNSENLAEFEEERKNLEMKLNKHKAEIKEHRLTIDGLEEQLNSAVNKNKECQREIDKLTGVVNDLNEKLSKPPSPPPILKTIIQRPAVDVAALEGAVGQLEAEKQEYLRRLETQQTAITSLRRDLVAANARLTDAAGELSDAQKLEMEKNRRKIKDQEGKLEKLNHQVASLSEMVDDQAQEIKELTSGVIKYQVMADDYKRKFGEQSTEMKILEDQLAAAKEHKPDESGEVIVLPCAADLAEIGANCRGERHKQVIERQREALMELRARLKSQERSDLKLTTNFNPTPEQTLQQVAMMRSELDLLRKSQDPSTIMEDKTELTSLDQAINRSRGLDYVSRTTLDVECSAHRETRLSLERSEDTYLSLVRRVSEALNLTISARSMANLSPVECKNLVEEREMSCEAIVGHIRVILKRLDQKEVLLKGYDGDLAKIREAQHCAAESSKKAEGMNDEIQKMREEIQIVRESYLKVKSLLHREKRLNENIKLRKTYHYEREFRLKDGWPHHECLEDPESRERALKEKKKLASEKAKKQLEASRDLTKSGKEAPFKLLTVNS